VSDLDYFCFQPTREGQASRAHVYEIVAGLRRRGWTIEIVEPPHPRPGAADGLRRLVAGLTMQGGYWLRRRLRPARVVYIRTHFLSLPTALLAKARGATVIQEINGPLGDSYDAWPGLRPFHQLLRWIVLTQLRRADAVIAVTPGLVEYYAALTGRRERYHVIGNGADTERFVPLDVASEEASRYVIFVGALASWQGVTTALRAAGDEAWPADIQLYVAGDGRDRDAVVAVSQTNPRVHWLGTVPNISAAELVAGSIGALVPMIDAPRSAFGLSPLKLFEAMAAGVPVIGSNLPGIRDVVSEHACGILFEPDDAHGLALAVARLVAEPERAAEMGRRGRDAAVARYSWDARAGQTDALLAGLVSNEVVRRSRKGDRETPPQAG
jgi:glycosyltransferase involved in cell wall biosynthesis